jgi:hypothetical protein
LNVMRDVAATRTPPDNSTLSHAEFRRNYERLRVL